MTLRRAAPVLVVAAVLGGAGGVGLHAVRASSTPRVSLPAYHGQATWRPGEHPAPAFALRDQDGALVSLHALRGKPVALVFLDSQCTTQCPIAGRELGSIMRRLPARARPQLVVVSVDPKGDTPRSIRRALAKWQLTGPWAVHWLNAPTRAQLAPVWKSYGVTVEPATNDIVHSLALYLIDRQGDERTGYLFPFLQSFVQLDLTRLAGERA